MSELLPKPDLQLGVYEHYKGKRYRVTGLALHSELLEWHVVYKPLYESGVDMWARPYDMFVGMVVVDGQTKPRFRFLQTDA